MSGNGKVPVFIAVTSKYDERMKRRIAVKATVASAGILVFFVVAGEKTGQIMRAPTLKAPSRAPEYFRLTCPH